MEIDDKLFATPEVLALRYYADPNNWKALPDADGRGMHTAVELDNGCRAQLALAECRPRHLVTVVALLITPEGRFLTSRRKHPSGKGLYACPGGSLEFGETLSQAAARETFEETGIKVDPDDGTLIDVDVDSNPIMGPWTVVFYRFNVSASTKAENKEPEKQEVWEWYSLANPPKPMVRNQEALFERFGPVLMHPVGVCYPVENAKNNARREKFKAAALMAAREAVRTQDTDEFWRLVIALDELDGTNNFERMSGKGNDEDRGEQP